MKFSKCISIALVAILLTGCSGQGDSSISNADIGTVLGGVGGAVLGSTIGGGTGQIAATALGAGAGALAGRAVGQTYDKPSDQQ